MGDPTAGKKRVASGSPNSLVSTKRRSGLRSSGFLFNPKKAWFGPQESSLDIHGLSSDDDL
jgi:hypothetical protein